MFFTRKPENGNKTALRMEIDRLFSAMADEKNKHSPEYAAMSDRLNVLYPLRTTDSEIESKKWISPEAVVTIAANLIGICLIVNHEQTAVMTSKALGLIRTVK